MSDDIRIDSHKLIYHPCRVAEWLNGQDIYPIGVEIALSSACNHRCTFCALDYLEYKPRYLEKDLLLKNLKIMYDGGLKSVVFAGEGEPLLNKNAEEIFNASKEIGLDISMSTNAVLMNEEFVNNCLNSFTWIRFSVAAFSDDLYKVIHKSKEGDLDKVYRNIAYASEFKKKNNLDVTLGLQMLMIPENVNEVVSLGCKAKELGVDYYTVKPYSQHPESFNSIEDEFNYGDLLDIEKDLFNLESDAFKVFFRRRAMEKLSLDREYDSCLGLPFFTYIDATSGVWPCIAYLGKEEFCYGKLEDMDFDKLWSGKRRKEVLELFKTYDISHCRELCRLDEINRYLYNLKNPGKHVNFI